MISDQWLVADEETRDELCEGSLISYANGVAMLTFSDFSQVEIELDKVSKELFDNRF